MNAEFGKPFYIIVAEGGADPTVKHYLTEDGEWGTRFEAKLYEEYPEDKMKSLPPLQEGQEHFALIEKRWLIPQL